MFNEHKFSQDHVQEVKDSNSQFFYMTNSNLDMKDADDTDESNNFTEGDIKIEMKCVNKKLKTSIKLNFY